MSGQGRFGTFATVFAAAYAVAYVVAMNWNWALFTYGPATGTFGPLLTPAPSGPTMYWYGWISTAAIAGGVVAFLATLLPAGVAQRVPPLLSWAVPGLMVLVLGYILRGYFFR